MTAVGSAYAPCRSSDPNLCRLMSLSKFQRVDLRRSARLANREMASKVALDSEVKTDTCPPCPPLTPKPGYKKKSQDAYISPDVPVSLGQLEALLDRSIVTATSDGDTVTLKLGTGAANAQMASEETREDDNEAATEDDDYDGGDMQSLVIYLRAWTL